MELFRNEKWRQCKLYALLVLVSLFVGCAAEDIKFFDDDGNEFIVTLKGGCYEFKPKWDNRPTAIEVEVGCFKVYKEHGCLGDEKLVTVGTLDLKPIGFAEAISSAKLCNPEEEQIATGKGSMAAHYSQQELWDVAVEEHNKYRRIHGVPDVRGNPDMHKDAQMWADQLASTGQFESTTMGKYGNNLATSVRRSKVEAIRDSIRRWYSKVKYYDWTRPGYNVDGHSTGSFSAIVWRSTTDIGIGIAWDEINQEWIVNCFYSPAAMRSGFEENVPPPRKTRNA